jgi:hypothetical protein
VSSRTGLTVHSPWGSLIGFSFLSPIGRVNMDPDWNCENSVDYELDWNCILE